jgi:acyl-CoA thioesterase-2
MVPEPDGLPTELELLRQNAKRIPDPIRDIVLADRPFDVRVVDPIDFIKPHKRPAKKYTWFRAVHAVPTNPIVQRALLTFASDYSLAVTALLPHGISMLTPGMQIASIDHALWFHAEVNLEDWHLYEMNAPFAGGGRGMNFGKIYNRAGKLIASTAQESLIRDRRHELS